MNRRMRVPIRLYGFASYPVLDLDSDKEASLAFQVREIARTFYEAGYEQGHEDAETNTQIEKSYDGTKNSD